MLGRLGFFASAVASFSAAAGSATLRSDANNAPAVISAQAVNVAVVLLGSGRFRIVVVADADLFELCFVKAGSMQYVGLRSNIVSIYQATCCRRLWRIRC